MSAFFLERESVVVRAANEGVPVAAIGRIIQQPFEIASDMLKSALSTGQIGSMPKSDWPPTAKRDDRLPSVPRSANSTDIEFACRKVFKLTPLEAGFMMLLLKYEHADKARLHNVIEQLRNARSVRPDKNEITDPKMVDVMICKLRKKLRTVDEGIVISTVWAKGYYLDPEIKVRVYTLLGGFHEADRHRPENGRREDFVVVERG